MFDVLKPPHLRVEMLLVMYGGGQSWLYRPFELDELISKAMHTLQFNPTGGERHSVDGVEVWTLHIRQPGKPAYHQFLYRILGNTVVDVGHLLHEDMPIQLYIPLEWRLGRSSRLGKSNAA